MTDRPFKCRNCKKELPLAVLYLIDANVPIAVKPDEIKVKCPHCGNRVRWVNPSNRKIVASERNMM